MRLQGVLIQCCRY